MRSFSIEERRARLARRHFLSPDAVVPAGDLGTPTAALIGWHATDPATSYLSLWARVAGFATPDLDGELYEKRSLVKQLAMRRTLWLVGAVDLPALQTAASDRVADAEERRLIADVERAGVTVDGRRWLDSAGAAVLRYLDEHPHATSSGLRQALPELSGTYDPAPGKSYGGETSLAPRVLTILGVRGEIVRGPNDGGWTTSRPRWAATTSWLRPGGATLRPPSRTSSGGSAAPSPRSEKRWATSAPSWSTCTAHRDTPLPTTSSPSRRPNRGRRCCPAWT